MYFYRDKYGREVDLIVQHQGMLIPVEIKSAATFSTSFVAGIDFFRSEFKNCHDGVVVYNGSDEMPAYKGVAMVNPLTTGWKKKVIGGAGGEGVRI